MKRVFTLASLCVLLGVALLSSASAQTPSGPTMVLPERSFDFKDVDEGKMVEHAFKVLNQGNQFLEIRNVKPG